MTQIVGRNRRRDGRVVVTQMTDFSIIEEVPDEVSERRTRPIPIPDLCALADMSVRPIVGEG